MRLSRGLTPACPRPTLSNAPAASAGGPGRSNDAPGNRKPYGFTPPERPRPERPNDEPIISVSDDKLHYTDYAGTLARQILETEPPVAIGIFGAWGSGKTSLMRLIDAYLNPWKRSTSVWRRLSTRMRFLLRRLRRNRRGPASPGVQPVPTPRNHTIGRVSPARRLRIRTIWINVWQLTNQEDVWHAFLQRLISRIRADVPLWKKIDFPQLVKNVWFLAVVVAVVLAGTYFPKQEVKWKTIVELIRTPGWPTVALGVALAWTIYKELKVLRPALPFDIKATLKTGSYRARISELARLDQQFAGFVTDLVGPNGVLVVFIDDLDRCSPKVIPEVLEAIKLFTANRQCAYVLGMDRSIVCGAIKQAYRFQKDVEALRYLDKIVQVPFQLPPLSEAAAGAFVGQLPAEAGDIFLKGMEANPRALKRAAQSYSTLQELTERLVERWEIDMLKPELLSKWLTIQMRFPELAAYIARDTSYLWRLESDGIRKRRDPAWPSAPAPNDAPKLDDADRQALDTILVMGDYRFGHRSNRPLIGSYIYMGNAAGAGAGQIRGGSRARALLLSGGPDQQQQFANQLAVWREIESEPDWGRLYQQRLRLTSRGVFSTPPGLPSQAEERQIEAACEALESAYAGRGSEPGTLNMPARHHSLGTGPAQLAAARQENLEADFADLERPVVDIQIPAFRIGRFPVTNEQYAAFVAQFRDGKSRSEPYGIVEYEAYAEPFFRLWWDSLQMDRRYIAIPLMDRDRLRGAVELEIVAGEGEEAGAEKFSVQFTPAGSRGPDAEPLLIPNRDGYSGVLERPDLFLMVTVRRVSFSREYHAYVRAWNKDREMQMNPDPKWTFPQGLERHPATTLTWENAAAYCMWLRKAMPYRPYRLLKEPEWETAATQNSLALEDKSVYPWGNTWDSEKANTIESGRNGTTPVDYYSPEGDSPFGVADMAGNVAEWCADVSGTLSWNRRGLLWDDVRCRGAQSGQPVEHAARGGSFRDPKVYARIACRRHFNPAQPSETIGFRVAIATEFETSCRYQGTRSESRVLAVAAATSPQR